MTELCLQNIQTPISFRFAQLINPCVTTIFTSNNQYMEWLTIEEGKYREGKLQQYYTHYDVGTAYHLPERVMLFFLNTLHSASLRV